MMRNWSRYAAILLVATAAVIIYAWIDLNYSLPWNPDRPSPLVFPVGPLSNACNDVASLPGHDGDTDTNSSSTAADAPIPNIVHYIWLLADPAIFSLSFKIFISVYSAHLFFQPDRIYIHTDASPELWDRTKTSGDRWTKRVLAIDGVTPNFVETPRQTTKGVAIDTFGAKSDFIRADALRRFGGIYLDADAVPLRDVAPLRRAGFASVVGGAAALAPVHTGFVNTGVWLSRPHSSLAEIFYEAMDAFYNGVWAISVGILTDLAYRLHAVPGEVLILNPRAFAPASFEMADQIRLFKPHSETPADPTVRPVGPPRAREGLHEACVDALAWLREREQVGRMESWEMDFSATYVLHAFDDDVGRIRGWDGQITPRYVLARQSNYARAVYPAVWHAAEAGIIPVEETL